MTDRLAALMPGLTVDAVGEGIAHANLMIWECAGGVAVGPPDAMPVDAPVCLGAQVGGGVWIEHLWSDMPAVRIGADHPLRPLIDLALTEVSRPRCGTATLMQGYVQAIIVHILRNAIEQGAVTSGILAGLADARLSRVLVALHDDLDVVTGDAHESLRRRTEHGPVIRRVESGKRCGVGLPQSAIQVDRVAAQRIQQSLR